MSEFYSHVEELSPSAYRSRWSADVLRSLVKDFPVTVLTGARQVGKSTLLRREEPFCSWDYVTLDDFDALETASVDPASLWAGYKRVVIDEVQKAPAVLDAIKLAVDQDPNRRFMLTGSANLLLMSSVSESLAGRAAYLELGPMAVGEVESRPAPSVLLQLLSGELPLGAPTPGAAANPLSLIQRGMMPRFLTLPDASVPAWWDGYVATYLERDLRSLSNVSSLPEFRRLMEALALRQGQLLNRSEVARDVRLSQATAHRYVDLLQVSEVFTLLRAYSGNRTKRLVKSPKPYVFDSGLGAFLCGHYAPSSLAESREVGAAFEGFVLQHIRALCQLISPRPRLHYWRTVKGREVDVVIEHGRSLVGIEIKLSTSVGHADTLGLKAFADNTPNVKACAIIYCGSKVVQLSEKIVAIPWTAFAG